ncbi:MAG TPA: U32 family peptidase [Desulfobulbaceae bacterium]|nr:U32 family peptidase [Desulfobulbaceae bacterium]
MRSMVLPSNQSEFGPEKQIGNTSMELLAPAGSFAAFEAALEQGADAVYVGAPGFNARALSRDFTFAEIDSMIRQAHGQGVKLYIAMNSLVKEDELPAAVEALSCFQQMKADALILQDLGLLYLARTWFPDLALHASTLMSVHNSLAAEELVRLGCERVVLARELTIDEMAEIYRKTGAQIEVFVHGAMCFSYSGLCMFSSLHGGKSSLRGQCVQPCRRHYSWMKPGRVGKKQGPANYPFSMNDLCGVDVLPELQKAGVGCLKIEGRMKSAQYVANTVAAYRLALDSLNESDENQEKVLREAHRLLDAAMARKRSTGYMLSAKPASAISPQFSGNSGLFLGKISGIRRQTAERGKQRQFVQLSLAAPVSEGDRLRLHDETTGERTSFTLRLLTVDGHRRKKAGTGRKVEIALTDHVKGMGHAFRGSLFKVDVGSRIVAERSGHKRRRKLAGRKVLPDRHLVEQIIHHLHWKQSRTQEKQTRKGRTGRRTSTKGRRQGRRELPWWVALRSISELRQRLPVRPAKIILPLSRENMRDLERLGLKIKKYQSRIIWRLPPILPESELVWYKSRIETLVAAGYPRFELGHLSQYGLFSFAGRQERQRLELSGHYSLNLLNSAALHGVASLGFRRTLFSLETESGNLAAALAHFRSRRGRPGKKHGFRQVKMEVGLYVYGRPPLFTARLDSDHFQYRNIFVSPREEEFTLEHRQGLTLARSIFPFSLLSWQGELGEMGVDYLLLDLTGGPMKKEASLLSGLLAGGGKRIRVLSGNFHSTLV